MSDRKYYNNHQQELEQMPKSRHEKIWKIIVIVASVLLILTSLAPFLALR